MKPDIVIGSDHAGFESKQFISSYLRNNGFIVEDIGCYNTQSMDYPDIANKLCGDYIESQIYSFGILICGTGQGMSMVANKYAHIRAGVAWNEKIAKLLREHNNANVLCLPSLEIMKNNEEYKKIVIAFLTTPFSKEERHIRRINKIINQ